MNNHEHEALPPAELPVPKLKDQDKILEPRPEMSIHKEVSGAKKAELPQSGHHPIVQTNNSSNLTDEGSNLSQVATSTTAPQIADDNDLIEREWVLKAKAIVAKTKKDPYEQNRAMGLYKADYMKKRFNKDIKISEI